MIGAVSHAAELHLYEAPPLVIWSPGDYPSAMESHRIRLVLGLAGACIFAAALAAPGAPQGPGQGGPPTTRTSLDPPLMSKGNLIQELFLALDHHDLKEVQALLKKGADPNGSNGLGFAPLDIAAASHQLDAMKALIAAGAKVDAASTYGTALMFAASTYHVEGARLLLSLGADPGYDRTDNITILIMAAHVGSPEIVGDLLARKVDVNWQDANGTSALMYASRGGHLAVVQQLLQAGARINGADEQKRTALMDAAVNGHSAVVKTLLAQGAQVNARDASGYTALMLASKYGDHPSVVRALLAGGADRKVTDEKGRTPSAFVMLRARRETASVLGVTVPAKPATRTSKQAVDLSLKALEASMLTFAERTQCVSCHHEGLGRITTGAARQAGLKLDPRVVQAQSGRIGGMLEAMRPLHEGAIKDPHVMIQIPLIEINEVSAIDSWLLAGMAEQQQPKTEAASAMARVLARQQAPNGSWTFSGPREPMQSSFFTFTALAIRSVNAYSPEADRTDTAKRIARAKAWLATAKVQNSEDRAGRLLGLKWANAKPGELSKSIAAIRADQRPDGGWAQLPNLPSDAYATGQALYALRVGAGMRASNPVYKRGVQFLLRTQDDDGSWFVNKRAMPANNYFDAGFPHGQSQYASFNATCWATLALLPEQK